MPGSALTSSTHDCHPRQRKRVQMSHDTRRSEGSYSWGGISLVQCVPLFPLFLSLAFSSGISHLRAPTHTLSIVEESKEGLFSVFPSVLAGSCAREDVVRGEGRKKARVAVTQPFRDPKSQSEASPSFLSQTMQPSNRQQVCSAERCCSLTFYQLSYFDTPGCPLTPAFPRVLGK